MFVKLVAQYFPYLLLDASRYLTTRDAHPSHHSSPPSLPLPKDMPHPHLHRQSLSGDGFADCTAYICICYHGRRISWLAEMNATHFINSGAAFDARNEEVWVTQKPRRTYTAVVRAGLSSTASKPAAHRHIFHLSPELLVFIGSAPGTGTGALLRICSASA